MSNLDREPFIDAPYHVLVQLAKRFQGRRFLEIDQSAIRNKSCLWRPCLLTDQNKVSNLYRGPSIDASYRVSADMAKRFQSRFFFLKFAQSLPVAAMFVNGSGRNVQSL